MIILVINAGSSSLKFALFNGETKDNLLSGAIECIGSDISIIKYKLKDGYTQKDERPIENHKQALYDLKKILDTNMGEGSKVDIIGHRVVHGGELFNASVAVDDDVIEKLESVAELAPLHNPANIQGIKLSRQIFPKALSVAVFDTAFHQTIPKKAYLYGIPIEDFKEHKIRKYGFHGISHQYISKRAAKVYGDGKEGLKIITCHLGNGSSMAAVKDGVSIDTTMGFTPLSGLVMGTRSGDIDPAIIAFLMDKKKMTIEDTISYLNKKSGVLGLSGLSNDFRDLDIASKGGHKYAKVALEVFAYIIKKQIGAYMAALGGLDIVVFSGGIGENDDVVRGMVMENMECFGIVFDQEKNQGMRKECVLSKPESKVKVVLIPTNEELMIANESLEIAQKVK